MAMKRVGTMTVQVPLTESGPTDDRCGIVSKIVGRQPWEVAVEIDWDLIFRQYGPRAVANKNKQCKVGPIVVKAIRPMQ